MNLSNRVCGILLVFVLLFTGAYRLAVINAPFGRNPEGCAAFFGLLARNYFRYDFPAHHGVPVMSLGQNAPVEFYAHHPPTTPLLIALVFKLTGYHGEFDSLPGDWQVRLPTAIFTLACIILICVLVKRRAGPRPALLASTFFATIPITLIYGGFPDVINPQLVFFALLTFSAYERFHDAPNTRSLTILSLCFAGAAIMDWPAFHMCPVMGVHFVLTRPRRQWKWIVFFAAICAAIFAVLYSHLALAHHDWLWMRSQLAKRTLNTVEDDFTSFGLAKWLSHALWGYGVLRHSIVATLLAICGFAVAATRRFRGGPDRLMGLLLAWAGVHIAIGAQAVYQHEWWWWPLTPGLVIAAGIGLDALLTWLSVALALSQRTLNITVAALLVCFAAMNARNAWIQNTRPTLMGSGATAYSVPEIGQAIRDAVRPDQTVVVTETDFSLSLWYYADRAMKLFVWDPVTFEDRMHDSLVNLNFNVRQPWPPLPRAVVIPKNHIERFPEVLKPFLAHLDAKGTRREAGKFVVYELAPEMRD